MRCFVRTLQYWGFEPKVVVTDGSNLYPAVLAELWPTAKHQLCVFHVLQDVLNQVLAAVRRLRAVRPTVARAVASVVVVGEPKEEHGSGDAGRRTRRRRPSCTGTGS